MGKEPDFESGSLFLSDHFVRLVSSHIELNMSNPPQCLVAETKVWGTTTKVHGSTTHTVHAIHVEPWMRCSMHHREHRTNKFFVMRGILFVRYIESDHPHRVMLQPGTAFVIPLNIVHRFETEAIGADVLEIYWGDPLDDNDIVRQDEGGKFTL